jgi:hypothetical protein
MNKALMSIFRRGCGQPNLSVIENLIEQIRGTNLESGAKEKVERLLGTVVRIENSILAMKIPFSIEARRSIER